MFNILVVEDDREIRELYCAALSANGYSPFSAVGGEKALEIMDRQYIDLIISDVMMPEMDGFELIRQLREARYDLPILVITAKGGIADKKEGFRAGTDDYMVKPVDLNEMLWRVNALLRRSQAIKERRIEVGQTVFDCDTLSVNFAGRQTELPQKEFFLLFKLVSSIGKIFTRRQLFDEIWGFESQTDMHTLDVHISRLREKLNDNPDVEIVTVRGLGYKAVQK